MSIRWLARAQRHLIDIHAFIAVDNVRAAQKVVRTIQASVPLLARHPQAGRAGRINGTREFAIPGTPYVVIYRHKGKETQILAIHHSAQQWPDAL